jgi:AraC-like DNA-binding protein
MENLEILNSNSKSFYEQQIERIKNNYGLPQYHYIQVRQSRLFMEKYLAEKIELEAIAAAAFMSRFHYIRIFQKIYGITPRQYLRDLRLAKAKELLRKDISVSQVCFDVGYDSVPTFCTTFKMATGHSPLTYQKLNKSNRE